MATKPIPIAEILTVLERTPVAIAEATAGLSPAQLRIPPEPDAWSVNDTLAHLRACADQWGDSIAAILAEEHPTLRAINPRSWIKRTDYPNLPFDVSFRAFVAQRADLLTTLKRLTSDDWARTATVTGAGAPLQRSILGFGGRLARHERPHLQQIESLAAALRRS